MSSTINSVVVAMASLVLSGGSAALAQGKPEAAKPEAAKPEAGKPEAGKPTGPPPIPKEMDQLKVFLGNWKCTGEAAGPEPGKTHKSTSENVIKADMGGFWLSVKHHEPKSKDNPMEFTAQGWWGYDATTKQFVGLFAGSHGVWEARSSKGWVGDTWVWAGVLHAFMGNVETQFRHTFTKKTDKEIAEKFEARLNDKWTTLGENTCKKQ
jgi:hypothetical protein